MHSGKRGRDQKLNKKKYNIPETLTFHDKNFQLTSALLFCGSLEYGHYRSIVRIGGTWIKYYDDSVCEMRSRDVFTALKSNRYGWVYGLIYETV